MMPWSFRTFTSEARIARRNRSSILTFFWTRLSVRSKCAANSRRSEAEKICRGNDGFNNRLFRARFTGLEAVSGHNEDATITFSTNFSFDFDNSDGVSFYEMDFETVAAHEIGHALGFISALDDVDGTTAAQYPSVVLSVLDLFRFPTAARPTTSAEFTTFTRDLTPGANVSFSDSAQTFLMSTGVAGGDGRQGSHWKDTLTIEDFLGLMEPTLDYGTAYGPSEADFRALDVIGWEVVPEPGSAVLALIGGLTLCVRRRRV